MRNHLTSATIALTLGLGACESPDMAETPAVETAAQTTAPMEAVATLMTADGTQVGTATVTQSGGGLSLSLQGTGMPAGEHGVHIHTTGSCQAPDFTSAGGHWNPLNKEHGLDDPRGQHAGDMPNLEVANDGTAQFEYTLGGGATFDGLMDADGSAIIVHALADDQMTDPSGESGNRIACGIFVLARGGTMGNAAL